MKDPTIQLWCEDEVHFQRHSSLMRMWAPKGQQPRVPSASTREKVGFFGAVNLKTGVLITKDAPTFNGETFGDFLDYLLQLARIMIQVINHALPFIRLERGLSPIGYGSESDARPVFEKSRLGFAQV